MGVRWRAAAPTSIQIDVGRGYSLFVAAQDSDTPAPSAPALTSRPWIEEEHVTPPLRAGRVRVAKDDGVRFLPAERDNIIVERLWGSLKYESVYLNAYETGSAARRGIGAWIELYNRRRPHSSLDERAPRISPATFPPRG